MPYFFCEGFLETNREVEIKGRELRHMRLSRKIRRGERIELQDEARRRFQAEVVVSRNRFVKAFVLRQVETPAESSLDLKIYCPPLKEKAFDFVLRKTTELGVARLGLFESDYSKKLPKGAVLEGRIERWKRVCEEACKQSERVRPPVLEVAGSLEEAVEESLRENEATFLFHHLGKKLPDFGLTGKVSCIGAFIGPEGGFTELEASLAGVRRIKIGERVLKAETTAVSAAVLLQYLFGDLGVA